MPYVYDNAEELENLPQVGTKECVDLMKTFGKAPAASQWTEGARVKGTSTLRTGTAIATFVNGKYPNMPSGNHAAFYLRQDAAGLWVIDQWRNSGSIRKRLLRFKGADPEGHYRDPVNNGDAFSVIE